MLYILYIEYRVPGTVNVYTVNSMNFAHDVIFCIFLVGVLEFFVVERIIWWSACIVVMWRFRRSFVDKLLDQYLTTTGNHKMLCLSIYCLGPSQDFSFWGGGTGRAPKARETRRRRRRGGWVCGLGVLLHTGDEVWGGGCRQKFFWIFIPKWWVVVHSG